MYYEILEDGTIGRSTPSQKIAQSLSLTLQTDKEIAYAIDGKRYFTDSEVYKKLKEQEEKELRIAEIKYELSELDLKSIRPARAGETERLAELETQAVELRKELQALVGYNLEPTEGLPVVDIIDNSDVGSEQLPKSA